MGIQGWVGGQTDNAVSDATLPLPVLALKQTSAVLMCRPLQHANVPEAPSSVLLPLFSQAVWKGVYPSSFWSTPHSTGARYLPCLAELPVLCQIGRCVVSAPLHSRSQQSQRNHIACRPPAGLGFVRRGLWVPGPALSFFPYSGWPSCASPPLPLECNHPGIVTCRGGGERGNRQFLRRISSFSCV